MKTRFFALPAILLTAGAWTLEADIGSGKISGQPVQNLHLQAESPDLTHWRITGSAGKIAGLNSAAINAGAVRDNLSLLITSLVLKGRQHNTPAEAVLQKPITLINILKGRWQLPEPLSLAITAGKSGSTLQLNWADADRTLTLAETPISAAQLQSLAAFAGANTGALKGRLIPEKLTLRKTPAGWQLTGTLRTEKAGWQSQNALQALENIDAQLTIRAEQRAGRWQADFTGSADSGEALLSPVYLNLKDTPLRVQGRLTQTAAGFTLENLKAEHRGLSAWLDLTYSSQKNTVTALTLHELSGSAQTLYSTYLKPMLQDSVFDSAALTGTFYLSADWRPGHFPERLTAVFNRVNIKDTAGRYDIRGLDGQYGTAGISTLRIGASKWKKIPFGPAVINLRQDNRQTRLANPATIPILDGALTITALEPIDRERYRLNAKLTPINLETLSTALGWPAFQGSLSGTFPNLTISKNSLILGKPIHINVFNGEIAISALRAEQLFSPAPLVTFAAAIRQIDLGRLTHALNIAEVQGNITGTIDSAALVNWQPQQFSAQIATDPQNPGRRRISHEAVQYLTKAGGSSAAIGQFVRVLNQFPYEKLGFSATLNNGVLTLDGVEPAENGGYYLVKGSGLPHLDIIGYQHQTSYQDLIDRLKAAANSDGPVIR